MVRLEICGIVYGKVMYESCCSVLDVGCIGGWGWGIFSYLVKISFVTAAMLYSSRRARDSASIRAVLPDPTGLFGSRFTSVTGYASIGGDLRGYHMHWHEAGEIEADCNAMGSSIHTHQYQ